MKKIVLPVFVILLFFTGNINAQAPPSWTSAEMYQAIKKLNVLGTVLYIAAHPDDENTRLIAWLSKDRLYRTGYLSLTRGDGGQNLISDEQGIELGLIRTQELLAARRIDGGEQFFTRAYDFGFSKNPEETFAKWDKEKVLSDVVWVIRKFQPDIIINRFPVTGEGGHGHHTASGILANEAFTAAADPTRFPEQLKYVSTWQAKRVMWNTFNFGGNNTTRDDQYKTDVGGYNPLLGKSYGEIAAESRSQHKSQGFGVPAGRGEAIEFFKATKGDQPVNDLMEGVDQSWKRVPGGEAIEKMVNDVAAAFDFLHPEKSVKSLVQLHKSIKNLPAGNWQKKKLAEVEQLIQQCSGLFIDATAAEQFAVVTDSIRINFSFNNRLGTDVILKKVSIRSAQQIDSVFTLPLVKNKNFNYAKTYFVDPRTRLTQPYWLENKMEEGYFNVSEQTSIGQADVDASMFLVVGLVIEGQELVFEKPVKYKFTDPVRGELYQPLVVLPSVTAIPQTRLIVKSKKETKNFEVDMLSLTRQNFGIKDKNQPNIPGKKYLGEPGQAFDMQKGQRKMWAFTTDTSSRDMTYTFFVRDPGETLKERHEIKHDHIPNINYFTDATVTVKSIDVKTHNKKIGYIAGAGDKVPEALEQMGYDVNMLTDKELSKNGLDKFDCIITGVRAYNTNEWLNKHHDKLMKYVQEGGNLIVQYNTSNQIGPVRAKIGPYQFNITRTRVTDENAIVTLLKPEHPAFNFPNKITSEDFNGWIQERSIYHASDTTGKFEKLIAMNDPGEKSDDGSLIVTRYGKGWFTYTGIVFFRELPAGVNGAYRLLANLIALNKKKGF